MLFRSVGSAVVVERGQTVTAATNVVEIIDPSALEVEGTVDEIDVLSVTVGAAAVISMDALGSRTLQGTVSEIGGTASNQNGVVSYPIRVRIDVPQGLQLREGLSATANVTVRSERNAILVPVTAIGGSFSRPSVRAIRDGREQTVEVELGISDESWVAVRQGLQDGDQVVLAAAAAAAADARLQRTAGAGQGQIFVPGGASTGPVFVVPDGQGGFRQGGGGN